MTTVAPEKFQGRALPTLNVDGSRRYLRPRLSPGVHWRRRAIVAYALIVLFVALPWLRINGKPAVLLDVVQRKFTIFGTTFLPTDTLLLMLLLVGIFVGIFLLTALFGRVWCGWACPQTVYLEFLYRPIERWIEGGRAQQLKLDRDGPSWRRALKFPLFFVISFFVANTFLAYFVGVERLQHWIIGSPLEHVAGFLIVVVVTMLMFLDFSWFREQTCAVACPYGRFQSVLLDRRSLIVGYDKFRGEPRGTLTARRQLAAAGDCIDCGACVATCPTGIDIRDGLQMECIHCTQCIDACDAVMEKIGRPKGLVRYTSRAEVEGLPRQFLRPRVIIYPLIIAVVWGALAVLLATRTTAEVTLLRDLGSPYTLRTPQTVETLLRLKLINRSEVAHQYTVALPGVGDIRLEAPQNPVALAGGAQTVASFVVTSPRRAFINGRRDVVLEVSDGASFKRQVNVVLLGPQQAESDDEARGAHDAQ